MLCPFLPIKWDIALKGRLKKVANDYAANRFTESTKELSDLIDIDLKQYGYR